MRRLVAPLILSVLAGSCSDPVADPDWRDRKAEWPAEVVAQAARLPVQSGGRIMPLQTWAGFQMLRLHGKRTFKTPWGEKLDPTEWALDCLFFPEQSMRYQLVRVDDTDVARTIGAKTENKRKRDFFSLEELSGSLKRIEELADVLKKKPASDRSHVERDVIFLNDRLPALVYMTSEFVFARVDYEVRSVPGLSEVFPNTERVSFLDVAPQYPKVQRILNRLVQEGKSDVAAMRSFARSVRQTVSAGRMLAFLPPSDKSDEAYRTVQDLLDEMLQFGATDPAQLASLRAIQKLWSERMDFAAFTPTFLSFADDLIDRASQRTMPEKNYSEFAKIDMEVSFFKADWFFRGLYGFTISFLCLLGYFLLQKRAGLKKLVYRLGWLGLFSGEIMLVIGVVLRCIIRERPPITTPYEVILSSTAVAVVIMSVVEWTRRSGLALTFAGLVGGLGLLLANWHESIEGSDTMAPLVAVLDTNFWLTIHVIVVSLGYCAGTLAAVISHLYIFGKLFGYRRGDAKYYSDLSRQIYGVLCFGLLFSTVGTILGGVWANDSWGRFWGWDPKENGALLLVLGYLATAHARLGGYIREFGVALTSIFLGMIVVWAFFGVNLLGIGLHSYGFSETMKVATDTYYLVEGSVLGLGFVAWMLERARRARLRG